MRIGPCVNFSLTTALICLVRKKYHAEPDTLAQPSKINLMPTDRVLVIGRSCRHGQIIGNHFTEPVHAYNWQLIGGCFLAYVINTTSPCFSNCTSWRKGVA